MVYLGPLDNNFCLDCGAHPSRCLCPLPRIDPKPERERFHNIGWYVAYWVLVGMSLGIIVYALCR